ncbi:hypothetical protein DSO57_1001930 [Entomophthora muscae]|uniref:Uncharacterized protein n=1 Tax=Entomophthora muscae TaxID=34485 RepID=A0ACC2UU61_9FUNG|nr:hypothetical protein DSO57_1001930 [Entomophthora muscae]
MFPKIVLEEIFSLLDHKQVYKLRLLCLAFYQAAFPLLLRIHSLKQVKYIDYQRFLKKNGRHIIRRYLNQGYHWLLFFRMWTRYHSGRYTQLDIYVKN